MASKTRKIISLFLSGEWSASLNKKVQGWLMSDRNREEKDDALLEAYNNMVQYDENPGKEAFEMLSEILSRIGHATPNKPAKRRMRLSRVWVGAAAAIIVLVIGYIGITRWSAPEFTTGTELISFSCQENECKEIVLPDGSIVQLKRSSTISYTGDFLEDRRLSLTGEAVMDVRKHEEKTFVIETGDVQLSVLGTKFNVRNYDWEGYLSVSLVEGSVCVHANNGIMNMEPLTHLIIEDDGTTSVTQFNEYSLMKINGQLLSFDNIPLSEACERIRHHFNDIDIGINNIKDADSHKINMSFNENAKLEEVLFVLKTIVPTLTYENKNNSIIITST